MSSRMLCAPSITHSSYLGLLRGMDVLVHYSTHLRVVVKHYRTFSYLRNTIMLAVYVFARADHVCLHACQV